MERKPVYEDFEVHTEWVHEPAYCTLIANLPGFRKEHFKVQITSMGNLRLSGERSIGNNKFSRFLKEIPIPSNCDQNKIRASFTGAVLHVKFHKLIVPVEEEEAKPSAKVPKPDKKPAADPRPADASPPERQKNGPGLRHAVDQKAPSPLKEKQADEVEKKIKPEEEKEMEDEKNAVNEADEKAMKEEKGTTSEVGGDSVNGSAADKAKLEPKNRDGAEKYPTGMDYKQVVEGFKNPRKIMNMVLAVLAVVVLGVYIRNAIMFLSEY